MKIAMLIWRYWPEPQGGAERQCRLLVKELARRGVSCTILAGRSARSLPRAANEDGVGIRRFGLLSALPYVLRDFLSPLTRRISGRHDDRVQAILFWLLAPAVWLSRLSFIIEFRLFARRCGPFDILHVHESGWLAGVGVAVGQRWGIPVICKEATTPVLGPISYDTPFRSAWLRTRLRADAWIAQTAYAAGELAARGLSPEKIKTLPNGVELPDRTARPERSDGVVYVGNLSQGAAWKAFDVLFAAWVRIVKAFPGARLTVVGGGDAGPWIKMLKGEGVDSSVHFAGYQADPSEAYCSAGIFVLPSRFEGMSNALLEAQSRGLACVVSDIPPNRALVEDGVNGLVTACGDAESLAAGVVRLLGDPGLRRKLGEAARRKMEQEHSIAVVADRLRGLYESLVSGRGKDGDG